MKLFSLNCYQISGLARVDAGVVRAHDGELDDGNASSFFFANNNFRFLQLPAIFQPRNRWFWKRRGCDIFRQPYFQYQQHTRLNPKRLSFSNKKIKIKCCKIREELLTLKTGTSKTVASRKI